MLTKCYIVLAIAVVLVRGDDDTAKYDGYQSEPYSWHPMFGDRMKPYKAKTPRDDEKVYIQNNAIAEKPFVPSPYFPGYNNYPYLMYGDLSAVYHPTIYTYPDNVIYVIRKGNMDKPSVPKNKM